MAHRPVPPLVNGQPLKQRLVALEQFLERIDKQALAKAARTRQEVVLALGDQSPDVGGLIDVVVGFFANLAKGLNADGQFALGRLSCFGVLL